MVSSWNLSCHQYVPYTARHQTDPALHIPQYKITVTSLNMITGHLDLSWCITLGAAPTCEQIGHQTSHRIVVLWIQTIQHLIFGVG